MQRDPTIQQAIDAIGDEKPSDYVLAPTAHADALSAKAPTLAELLRSSEVQGLARQYERYDRQAGAAQTRFKRAMWRANGAVLATGVLGAVIMVIGILSGSGIAPVLGGFLAPLGLAALVTGALASMWLFRVREGKLLDEWMGERAHAETRRLAYFSTLTKMEADTPSEPPIGLLKLEYFRRYQLDVQLTYYDRRGQQHRESADLTLTIGGFAAALAAVASGSAGVVASFNAPWASLAALGVVGTALAAYAASREAMNQDRRNAERYGHTLSSLEMFQTKLDEIRAGVLKGSQDVLDEYVAAVQEQLSLEHREWLSGAEATSEAITKMDATLKALREPDAGQGQTS